MQNADISVLRTKCAEVSSAKPVFAARKPELPPTHTETLAALARWAQRAGVDRDLSLFPTVAELAADIGEFRQLLRAAFAA